VIQVSVQEINEFYETTFIPPFLENEGYPPKSPQKVTGDAATTVSILAKDIDKEANNRPLLLDLVRG
jgi:hypothetical protein